MSENTIQDTRQLYKIEDPTAFSKSKIWDIQAAYFKEEGIDAWRKGMVPHYVTSNPFTGKTYAEIVFAFLRDLSRKGETNEPVYIVELGAGHGRLCFHFLKYIEQLFESLSIKLPPICYVLTDISQNNLDFWKTHPRLQPYLNRGWLDYAIIDAASVNKIDLQFSGKSILPNSLTQPIVLIANYFFDSIPQELFYISDKKLNQSLISLHTEHDYQDSYSYQLFDNLQLHYSETPTLEKLYKEPYLNSILDEYKEGFEETFLLFPHIGLQCIDRLKQFSRNGMVLLTADKGYHRMEELDYNPPPQIVAHGSFSLPVNYHAFNQYCSHTNGVALFPKHLTKSLISACLLMVDKPQEYEETMLAYKREVDDFGPDDFYCLKAVGESVGTNLDFHGIISSLRFSNYDAVVFAKMVPRIHELAKSFSTVEKQNLVAMMQRVWDNYYPLGERDNLAFLIGELFYKLTLFPEAIAYFSLSIKIYGETPEVLYNIALCHSLAEEYMQASSIVEKILETNPEHELSIELSKRLETVKIS